METQKFRWHKPDLDDYIASQCGIIKSQVTINAESYGARDLPPPQAADIRPYFEEDHLKYQGLVDEVNRQLQFQTTCHQLTEQRKEAEASLRDVRNHLAKAREEQIHIDAKTREAKAPYSKHRIPLVWFATAAICAFDGILAIGVFETWAYSFIESILMGLLYSAVLALFAHFFERIVAKGKDKMEQRTIAATLLALLSVLFFTMASHRAASLSQQVSEQSSQVVHFSPWPFTLISILLFVVAIAIHHFYYPTTAQRAAMRDCLKLGKQKRENETRQSELKRREANIATEYAMAKHMHVSLLEYAASTEDLIVSSAHEAYLFFKKTTLMHRLDGFRPLGFDTIGYPFTWNTNFHSVKQLEK